MLGENPRTYHRYERGGATGTYGCRSCSGVPSSLLQFSTTARFTATHTNQAISGAPQFSRRLHLKFSVANYSARQWRGTHDAGYTDAVGHLTIVEAQADKRMVGVPASQSA
jgi:hypothetical protein